MSFSEIVVAGGCAGEWLDWSLGKAPTGEGAGWDTRGRVCSPVETGLSRMGRALLQRRLAHTSVADILCLSYP